MMDKAKVVGFFSSSFECGVCKDRFRFQAQLNFHVKRNCNKTSNNPNSSLSCVKFGKLPGLPDVSTKPFRVSRAFLKLTDPKLFRRLENKKNDAPSNPVPKSAEVERTIHLSTPRGSIKLSPVSTHVRLSQPRPSVPAFKNVPEIKTQNSSTCPSLNVNPDDSVIVIDMEDAANDTEDSKRVQNKKKLEKPRVDDVEQISFNCPLASSTPKPKTVSSSGQDERKRIKLSALLAKKREKKTTVPNQVTTTTMKPKTSSFSKSPPRSSASVLNNSYIKKCPHCNQNIRFRDDSHYRNHLKVHEGLRPFLCTTCNFGYKTDLELLEHASIKHLKEPAFNCPTCSSIFITKNELDKHHCANCSAFTAE